MKDYNLTKRIANGAQFNPGFNDIDLLTDKKKAKSFPVPPQGGNDKNRQLIPFMNEYEIKSILCCFDLFENPVKALEWGSGNSSIYFSSKLPPGSTWDSIEHDLQWAKKVTSLVNELAIKNVHLHYVPNNCEFVIGDDGNYKSFHDYILFPTKLGKKFQVVVVDGRARVECMQTGWMLLEDAGVMILHDAQRTKYERGIPPDCFYLRIVNTRIDCEGNISTLFMSKSANIISKIEDSIQKILPEYIDTFSGFASTLSTEARKKMVTGPNHLEANLLSKNAQCITWEQIKQMPIIRLYAGDVPAQKEYEGVVGLSLTRNDRNHIRHDITKPFPLADNAVDSFQAEDVFEHIQYEKLLPVVNEIDRILKPGGLFRLSVPDYGCDVLQDRCKKSEKGQILFDPGGGGTPDNPGHVWFPRIDTVRGLLEKTKFHKSGTIEFLHYYNMDGTFVVKPIDYTKGHVTRTPDFDERVKNPCRPMSLVVDLTKATPLHIETMEKNVTRTEEDMRRNQAVALNKKGEALFTKGDIDGALKAFNKAINVYTQFAAPYNNLGALFWQRGKVEDSLKHFIKAFEIDPDNRNTILNCAQAFESLQGFEEARKIYSIYLKRNPDDKEIASALAQLKTKTSLSNHNDFSPRSPREFSSSSAKIAPEIVENCNAISEAVNQPSLSGIEPQFFIFGPERSGTTLLAAMLTSNSSDVFVLNDPFIFQLYQQYQFQRKTNQMDLNQSLMKEYVTPKNELEEYLSVLIWRYNLPLPGKSEPTWLKHYTEALNPQFILSEAANQALTLRALFDLIYSQLAPIEYHTRKVFGEKTPIHTFYSAWIRYLYPNSKVVAIVRNPVTNIASLYKRMQPKTLDEVIDMYLRYFDDRLKFLYDGHNGIIVRYEDLINSPQDVISRIYDYLNVSVEKKNISTEFNYYIKQFYTGTSIDPSRDLKLQSLLAKKQKAKVVEKCQDVFEKFYPDEVKRTRIKIKNEVVKQEKLNVGLFFLSRREAYRPVILSTSEVFFGPDCQTSMDGDKYRTIQTPVGVYDIKPFIEQLPSHQTPELVVVKADATGRNFPINLQTLKCPKLLILGNTQHLKTPIRALLEYALQEKFDFIMSDHKRHHLHYFKEIGFEKVFWLPAFNIFPHKQPHYEDKRYEVSFVGQAGKWHPYRKYILQYLKANGVPVNHFQVPPIQAAEIYAQSLVNLNVSLNGDLNLRVFEVLSSGGFLLTDKLTMESGLELLFKDGQHLVCFENDRDLLDKIQYFLKHPDEAKAIAQNGYEEFQRNHTPEKKIKELSDYIFSGELNSSYDIKEDKRSIYVNTDSQTELIRRVTLYEFFQEVHLTTTSASILFWPEVDGRLACDVLDLPRLRLFIKNDSKQIPDQNTRLFQNTDMAERIKLVTTEQLRQMDLFWNTLVITASELLTIGLENLLTSMKFKWLVISDGFDALEQQQKKTFKDILAAAGFEKRSEGLELYYWKDKNLWGEVLYSENKIAEAISCFGQALLENPSHCDALNNLGVISYHLEQFENAEKLLLKAVGLNRRNANTLINLAHLYLRMKRYDDAAELFQEAASLDTDDASLWFHLGLCYEQSNRKTDALQAFKHCNELGSSEWPTAEKIRTLSKRTAAKRPKRTSKVILPPKRILVINNLYPPQELGGYGRLLCDFANILENRGHSIYVLTSDTPYLGPIDQDQPDVDRSLVLFGGWQNGVCKPIEDREKIIQIIKKNDEKLQNAIKRFSPQLCLLGNIDFLSHSILQPLLKSGIPVIHHLGSPNPGYSVADTPKEKLYIPAAASGWLKEQIVRQGYAFKDFRVIYPGALVKQFKMSILPHMDKLRIAYASIVLPYKGPHILINALKKLHDMGVDFSCSLAGTSTDEKFVNSLKNFVTQTGMDEKVTFLGFLPRGDLKDFFARHNVLAFPSLVSEAFGISQVEAMAAGLTVVTSGTGGAKEIVEHRLSGVIFNSGDHQSLARELLQLAEDKERWRQIALAGQERALQSFDIEKSVDDIERIYCHLTQYSEKGIKRGRKTRSSSKRYMVGKIYSTPDISTIPSQSNRINPLVSIIMPAYNAAEYIAAAIESVLSQNYRNFELIIVDDGSTDNTKDIIAGFKDEKIKYFYKENAGAASARNLAIKKSKGDFLITLDADDMIAPDFIAKHLQQFEKHPETDLVYCDDYLIDEDGKPTQVSERPEYPDRKSLIKDLFRYGCPIVPFRTCIRKSVFDKIGFFDEDLLVGENYDMMRRFVKSGLKTHHLKDALYLRRITPNNLSRNSTAQNAKCHFEVVKRFTDTFAYDELFPDVSWDEIPPQMRQLHAKCLAAATYVAIGHAYIESNSPAYAERASKLACSELNDCLKIDPNNEQIRQLLQKYELLQAKWTEESPASCFIGKT